MIIHPKARTTPQIQAEIKALIVEMVINGSGIRDTTRVLHISKGTVISTLKKPRFWFSVILTFTFSKNPVRG